jgi:hypothetical protein
MQQPSATLASTATETDPSNKNTTSNPNIEVGKAANAVLANPEPEPPFSTFTHTQKIVLAISFIGLLSPLSASIYFPAINTLAGDLHVSVSDINLTVTSYLVSPCLVRSRSNVLTLYSRSSKLLVRRSLATCQTSKAEDQLSSAALLYQLAPTLRWPVNDHTLHFWSCVASKALVQQLRLL